MRDWELYRGVYCSLCRTLGKRYGIAARALLSYDMTFFALLLLARAESCCGFKNGRCPFNLTKKCKFCREKSPELEYAADMTVILAYHKNRDNISDEKLFSRLKACLLLPFLKLLYSRARKKRPAEDKAVCEAMAEQLKAERSDCGTDRAAHPSAECLGKLFSATEADETEKTVLYRFGYCLGRWIYLADAYDDMEKDMKDGSFNPLLKQFSVTDSAKIPDCSSEIVGMLNIAAGEAAAAFELLNFKRYRDIIENIVYDGMYMRVGEITKRRSSDVKSV